MTYDNVKTIADLLKMAAKVHGDKVYIRYEKDDVVKDVTFKDFLTLTMTRSDSSATSASRVRFNFSAVALMIRLESLVPGSKMAATPPFKLSR